MKTIILIIEGGLIQAACGIPEDVKIVVRDYDEGLELGSNPRVHKDKEGDLYFENTWTSAFNDDTIAKNTEAA